ncbi:transposase [Bradyrhizobium cajani]|uniref:transposase n=1 Tax=Bradyrhizobium cajani TaxID=1928661 RepID=UPI00197AA405|nr:transposase [Bradyrhizobium cajani]MCP3368689.1 transposase [Bradyrhizobium cajani]
MIEAKPEHLIGDRAYDSDALDEELRSQGIEMIAPHRSNRVRSLTQDGRRLRRYARRWLVERFFAWIQMATAFAGPMGVLSAEFSRLRPARLPADLVPTILR